MRGVLYWVLVVQERLLPFYKNMCGTLAAKLGRFRTRLVGLRRKVKGKFRPRTGDEGPEGE